MSTAWSYVKKFWGIVALVAGVIVAFFLLRRRDATTFTDQLKKIQDAHDEEIRAIALAREEEQQQRLINEKRLQDALEAVQLQYNEAKKNLDSKKKKEIEDLVKEHGDDPEALARKLSELTGFVIVMPS